MTWFRAYDAGLGRWISSDPIAEDGGLNLYGYVGNDPVNGWDPLGLFSAAEGIIVATFAAVAIGIGIGVGISKYNENKKKTNCSRFTSEDIDNEIEEMEDTIDLLDQMVRGVAPRYRVNELGEAMNAGIALEGNATSGQPYLLQQGELNTMGKGASLKEGLVNLVDGIQKGMPQGQKAQYHKDRAEEYLKWLEDTKEKCGK